MATLDYATFFETHVRPRQRRRRILLGLAAAIVWVLPVAYVGLATGGS